VHVTARGLDSRVADRLAAMRHVRVVPNAPIDELLAGAALLLVPSLGREAFGRIAFEGMAAGVPTLAGAVGGLRELVPAAQLVEPPESIAGWSAAIEGLGETSYWRSAQEAGRAAAAATLARRGIETIETVLAAAAARPERPPQQLSGYDLAPL
jgi:glycosyltransferase involved in cell wall biosynthesis